MIQGIVFDFDGLVIDTETPVYDSWQELYALHGERLDFADWQQVIGTMESDFDPYLDLARKVGRELDWETLENQRSRREWQMVLEQPLLPGVLDYLESARQAGLGLAVASSSPHKWVDTHLKRLGLFEYFQTVKCAGDAPLTKPDPGLYLAAVETLGLTPRQALALEDSPNGALAAYRAGLFTVVVPQNLTAGLEFSTVDLRLDSLAALPLPALVEHANRILERNGRHA